MERPFRVSLIGDAAAAQKRAVFHATAKLAGRCLFYKERVDFLLGGDAAFLRVAAAAVRCANEARPSTTARLLLFLPDEGEPHGGCPDFGCAFDGIERIPAAPGAAFPSHLRALVDRADFCAFYIAVPMRDTCAAMAYAAAAQKPLCNLADDFLPQG